MTCIHRTNLGQQWLKPRKRQGTTACSEKARSAEAVYGMDGQGKTCMAKAILLEPQFAATYTASGAAERLTRRIGKTGSATFTLPEDRWQHVDADGIPAFPTHPLYGGASERTGRLNTSLLPTRVITGCPIAGAIQNQRPVWARSRHITQTPGVTAGTAARIPADNQGHKRGATRVKTLMVGGRAAAFTIKRLTTEVC